MKKKIIIFRAMGKVKNIRLEKKLSSTKFDVISYPIMRIKSFESKKVNTEGCQAILITSFNSLLFLDRLIDDKNIKIFTLGMSSFRQAKELGFKNIIDCDGDGAKMVDIILNKTKSDKGKIIYAGAKKISVNIPEILKVHGYQVKRLLLYHTEKITKFSNNFLKLVEDKQVEWIVLLSQKGAKHFYNLFEKKFGTKEKLLIKYACISLKVAKELDNKKYKTYFAKKPSTEEIKNLITNYEKNHGNL